MHSHGTVLYCAASGLRCALASHSSTELGRGRGETRGLHDIAFELRISLIRQLPPTCSPSMASKRNGPPHATAIRSLVTYRNKGRWAAPPALSKAASRVCGFQRRTGAGGDRSTFRRAISSCASAGGSSASRYTASCRSDRSGAPIGNSRPPQASHPDPAEGQGHAGQHHGPDDLRPCRVLPQHLRDAATGRHHLHRRAGI